MLAPMLAGAAGTRVRPPFLAGLAVSAASVLVFAPESLAQGTTAAAGVRALPAAPAAQAPSTPTGNNSPAASSNATQVSSAEGNVAEAAPAKAPEGSAEPGGTGSGGVRNGDGGARAVSSKEEAPREHFASALGYYRAGRYRRAIVELEQALALDPKSKDLLFNLSLVHEKLGQLREAIAALERYRELERDPAELARTDQALVRLRGARVEQLEQARGLAAATHAQSSGISSAGTRVPLLSAAAVSVTAALTGVVFGIRALSLRPDADPETRPGRSLEEIRSSQRQAETAAKVSDVSFAIGLAAGAVATAIWFSDKSCRCSVTAGPLSVGLRRSF